MLNTHTHTHTHTLYILYTLGEGHTGWRPTYKQTQKRTDSPRGSATQPNVLVGFLSDVVSSCQVLIWIRSFLPVSDMTENPSAACQSDYRQ